MSSNTHTFNNIEGYVYVFKNTKTNRVKVGATNDVNQRLRALNRDNPELEYYNGNKNLPLYVWTLAKSYKTKNYYKVEKLSHNYLKNYIDNDSPIGEVFKCTVEEASKSIECSLRDLGIYDEAVMIKNK